MKVIKHQKEDADKVIMETDHRKIDRDTAFFLNRTVNLGLEYEEKEGVCCFTTYSTNSMIAAHAP